MLGFDLNKPTLKTHLQNGKFWADCIPDDIKELLIFLGVIMVVHLLRGSVFRDSCWSMSRIFSIIQQDSGDWGFIQKTRITVC